MMISHIHELVGSRVHLVRNLFVEGGLYNGALGSEVCGLVSVIRGKVLMGNARVSICAVVQAQ
jgi:hypothetical protein